ncbi:DNA repair endonuclease XPF [Orchesella cincta]|uniref:DNA repair endonuclease XPF n=1 Tax=Orchesella cincta TaxID=48709 RepID=A0A1D2NLE5_ORCCI|nr:DNA repair endonuclease XPF [Orchesella cincta]
MLQYEKQLLLDVVQEDNQLYVFGKGIPVEKVMINILKTYACDTNLVFVLSTSSSEEKYYVEHLQGEKILSITTEYSATERKELYAKGGVFFITARILVEAFILRLYRSKNKTGFIKAFSQSPASFLLGFSKLNRVMRSTFLGNVSLWPRFHAAIKETLTGSENASASDVIEIQLRLSEEMRDIQSNLLDLITWSVSELKRLVPALNDEDVAVETALTKGFEKIVAAYVDPVWNTINSKSKEILNDLKIFRLLLAHLTKSDCVTFYSTLCNYTSHDAVLRSSWVLTKSAENIILAARKRIFSSSISASESSGSKKSSSSAFKPEIHPKWLALGEILNEIAIKKEKLEEEVRKENEQVDTFGAKLKTLIFTEDVKTSFTLRDYLCHGSETTLAKLVRNSDNIKLDLPPDLLQKLNQINKDRRAAKRSRQGGQQNDDGSSDDDEADRTTEIQITLTQIERKYMDVEFLQTPVFIRPFRNLGDTEAFGISETLEKLKPDVLVLFDPNLELVRNIEVHRARVADVQNVKVYFLSFRNSVEEQIYLTSIQREKMAFERLIEEKGTMVIPEDREAKDELNQDLWRDPRKANETVSTSGQSKRNMEAELNTQHVILVDMREFRSELPSLIHKRGIDLEPITLDVGDYILTPELCVERKSISDLIGSLNSGRLYKQAEAMSRHYKKPVLLIEQEQTQSVKAGIRYRNELQQIMPKLQLLTMNFPKLKLVWSPGAHYTSELFHELKRGKEQPNPDQALSILKEATGTHLVSKYNPVPHSFLSKMPGIDSRNVYTLLNRCDSLLHLVKLTEEELSNILENAVTAKALYTGIHSKILLDSFEVPKQKANPCSKPGKSTVQGFRVGLRDKGRRQKK